MDEALLYKLAQRLATFPGDPGTSNPQVIVGDIPQPLPINIPLPVGSSVLGSIIRSPRSLQILLDVPVPRSEVDSFYKRELQAAGWEVPEQHASAHIGGFMHRGFGNVDFLRYIHSSGAEITIQMSNGENGATDLRLMLKQGEGSQTTVMHRRRTYRPDGTVLPALVPPEASSQLSRGGSSGDDNENGSATLQLKEDWDLARLATHYTDQLVQASWTQTANEASRHAMWSTWTFRVGDNEEWQAVFYLFKLPDEQRRYHLSLYADLKKSQSQASWFA